MPITNKATVTQWNEEKGFGFATANGIKYFILSIIPAKGRYCCTETPSVMSIPDMTPPSKREAYHGSSFGELSPQATEGVYPYHNICVKAGIFFERKFIWTKT